ncbi:MULTISPECIES: Shedu immune nuclease family protein [Aphanothece]|uniref:Shedu immune nuclease family protein n=1 Tax=Aphanothece TaxID=1121 RepID=UPI0039854801
MFDPDLLRWPSKLQTKRLRQCHCITYFDFDWEATIGHSHPTFKGLQDLSSAIEARAQSLGLTPVLVLTTQEDVHYNELTINTFLVAVVAIRPFIESVDNQNRAAPFFMQIAQQLAMMQKQTLKSAQLIATLSRALEAEGDDFTQALEAAGSVGAITLLRAARRALDGSARRQDVITLGEVFENESATFINDLATLVRRRQSIEEFQKQFDDKTWNEEDWQKFFERHSWILGHSSDLVFSHVLKPKAVVRPSDYTNKGERQADFLMRTAGTKSFARIIEIKKPQCRLVSRDYRTGIPIWSEDLTGGVNQTIAYCHNLEGIDTRPMQIANILPTVVTGIMIIGSLSTISDNDEWMKAFENYRSHLHGISILCFDELLDRGKQMIRDEELRMDNLPPMFQSQ